MERLSVARDEKEDSPRIANLDKQIQILQREQEGWSSVTLDIIVQYLFFIFFLVNLTHTHPNKSLVIRFL